MSPKFARARQKGLVISSPQPVDPLYTLEVSVVEAAHEIFFSFRHSDSFTVSYLGQRVYAQGSYRGDALRPR